MKLCGFEIGLDNPLFLTAGRTRKVEQVAVGGVAEGCDPGVGRGPAVRPGSVR